MNVNTHTLTHTHTHTHTHTYREREREPVSEQTFRNTFRSSQRRGKHLPKESIHRKTPVLEFPFNNVAALKTGYFMKKRLIQKCFPVKIVKSLRIPVLKNSSKCLFPYIVSKLEK